MKVLITTWVFPTHGGVFSFLERVIPQLAARGDEFDVMAVAPSSQARRPFPGLPSERVHNVRQLRLPRPFSFPLLSFILATVRTAKTRGCELIFCQDPFYSGIPSLFASKLLDLPLIVADHGMITNFTERDYWHNFGFRLVPAWQMLSRVAIKAVLNGASLLYAPGPDIAERVKGLFGTRAAGKMRTFPIGIDTERFRPSGEARDAVRRELALGNSPTAVFVGRLHVESGLEYLVEAVRLIPEGGRPVVLIVGDGALRPKYEGEAEAKAPGAFRFLGYSDRVPEYLNAADIFVFPKVFAGGYSISLREAMATGLPSIATASVDSHDRIIRTGTDGLLVPARDAGALSREIARLLSNPGLRAALGSEARRTILEHFSMEGFRSQLEELFSQATRRRSPRSE